MKKETKGHRDPELWEDLEDTLIGVKPGDDTCQAHSGLCMGFKLFTRDQEAQWAAIKSINSRMWAILIAALSACGLMVLQLVINHLIK